MIKAELTRLAAGQPFIMLALKLLLADDIAVDLVALCTSRNRLIDDITITALIRHLYIPEIPEHNPWDTTPGALFRKSML